MTELLRNPVVQKMILLALGALVAVAFVYVLMRLLRAGLTKSGELTSSTKLDDSAAFSVIAYEAMLRRVKEQEKELAELRKADRDRATESASISEAVLSNLGSGVILFNTANIVRQANAAAKNLLGYSSPFGLHVRDIFRGVSAVRVPETQRVTEMADAEGTAVLVSAVELCNRTGMQFRRLEADYVTPSSQQRVLGITISPVRGAAGEPLGSACLVSDLTEITNLARQMRLRENMAALGEMSAGIAHEFKNSLATISGYAQMLQDDASAPEFAGKIADETAALSRIVSEFLNFAKPQGFAREPIELQPMIEDCAREAGVRLQWEQSIGSITLTGDPVALRQAFSNLLRNSAEAVPEGLAPIVHVDTRNDARGIYLELRDNGCGISSEQLARIFIPFFTTKSKGTGLGLALVHRIVTEHGGSVAVRSAGQDQGTTFTLAFPLEYTVEKPRIAQTKAE